MLGKICRRRLIHCLVPNFMLLDIFCDSIFRTILLQFITFKKFVKSTLVREIIRFFFVNVDRNT